MYRAGRRSRWPHLSGGPIALREPRSEEGDANDSRCAIGVVRRLLCSFRWCLYLDASLHLW
jgi:hypothetical protein